MNMQKTATLGGGCFWCVEAVIQRLKGVSNVKSGYSGGTVKNPTYREVCSGKTGHAEVIQFNYDESQISYKDLINIFLRTHDPTTLNQQGYDSGPMYRSIIFYHDQDQKKEALDVIDFVEKYEEFYTAEKDHQNFYNDNLENRYCRAVINPKVYKLEKEFDEFVKDKYKFELN
ncbi:Peptide methionine sulfoxide reductase MsrA [Pseudocohnilembus persalinus]|uniref:peptide-methionine (S)-S-oxide reductase n=1 Tax=Pseudocohnilembus persalinus TaxID=266149 RepID=A0A0V0QKP1_PSEPJ|nr:Peptide methionine sulfoxide reductase MsrA [Pseudocohnilembus persalinus]|eukprot:KRX02795.1 Peptide methionine sulfoxide reductase MsrA [Pseudocohnilembus persalinus]